MKNYALVKSMLGMSVENWDAIAIPVGFYKNQNEIRATDLCLNYLFEHQECSKRAFLKYIEFIVDELNITDRFGDLVNIDKIRKLFFSPNPLGL